jgi:hypothetical protein
LRVLFGFQAWTAQRKDIVTSLLDNEGIRAPLAALGGQPVEDLAAHRVAFRFPDLRLGLSPSSPVAACIRSRSRCQCRR